jgi:pyruvate formate lyase activating enzyme
MAYPPGRVESGTIFNIQRYSTEDGPGIRTTVFLKGCPLCCAWCHNPEGISPRKEIVVVETRCVACGACRAACPFGAAIVGTGPLPARHGQCTLCAACVDACPTGARQMIGRIMTVSEVVAEAAQDRLFYDESGGGVTLSGGEPLAQPQFVVAVLRACRDRGLHVALDTSGFGDLDDLRAAARLADLVLYDLKTFDDARHRRLTGVSNRSILDNLRALAEEPHDLWIRVPVVPGFNDDPEDLARLAQFVSGLPHVTLVNLLPFHRAGLHKFARLGLTHELDGVATPSVALLERVVRVFTAAGLRTKVGG